MVEIEEEVFLIINEYIFFSFLLQYWPRTVTRRTSLRNVCFYENTMKKLWNVNNIISVFKQLRIVCLLLFWSRAIEIILKILRVCSQKGSFKISRNLRNLFFDLVSNFGDKSSANDNYQCLWIFFTYTILTHSPLHTLGSTKMTGKFFIFQSRL